MHKVMKSSPLLGPFCGSEFWGFSLLKIKKGVCVFMFQTWDNSQLLRRVLWINAELTVFSSLKYKNTQPICIFKRENPQNSEPQNGPRRGLDFIALSSIAIKWTIWQFLSSNLMFYRAFQKVRRNAKWFFCF